MQRKNVSPGRRTLLPMHLASPCFAFLNSQTKGFRIQMINRSCQFHLKNISCSTFSISTAAALAQAPAVLSLTVPTPARKAPARVSDPTLPSRDLSTFL